MELTVCNDKIFLTTVLCSDGGHLVVIFTSARIKSTKQNKLDTDTYLSLVEFNVVQSLIHDDLIMVT